MAARLASSAATSVFSAPSPHATESPRMVARRVRSREVRRALGEGIFSAATAAVAADADGSRGALAAAAVALRALVADDAALDAGERAAAEAMLRDEDRRGDAKSASTAAATAAEAAAKNANATDGGAARSRSYYQRMRRAAGFASPVAKPAKPKAEPEPEPEPVDASAFRREETAGSERGWTTAERPLGGDSDALVSPAVVTVSLEDILSGAGAKEALVGADEDAKEALVGEDAGTDAGFPPDPRAEVSPAAEGVSSEASGDAASPVVADTSADATPTKRRSVFSGLPSAPKMSMPTAPKMPSMPSMPSMKSMPSSRSLFGGGSTKREDRRAETDRAEPENASGPRTETEEAS